MAGGERTTLNDDVRLLGAHGVISLNVVTSMDKLAETRTAAAKFVPAPRSTPAHVTPTRARHRQESGIRRRRARRRRGRRRAAKKLGLLGIILAVGKKFIVLLLAGGAAIAGAVRRLFGGRKAEAEDYASDYGSGPAAFEDAPAESAAEPTPDRTVR